MGKNKGFEQERKIVKIINNRKFKELPNVYQSLIEKIFGKKFDDITLMECIKKEGKGIDKKTDLIFTINNQKKNLSVKMGLANAIHQEPLSDFINFLNKIKNLTEYEINLIKYFHWCDGTYDNSGLVKDRTRKDIFVKKHKDKYCEYLKLLRNFKKEIFSRAWIGSINKPEYLIYFENENSKPKIYKLEDMLSKHLDFNETGGDIGLLSLQNWNACLKGNDHGHSSHKCDDSCPKKTKKNQKHRMDIQFKSKNIKKYSL